jgi:PIN domain nuclease of toxin-antitoxin system
LIAEPTNDALVSVASLWEIAIKRSIGKLSVPDDLPDTTVQRGFAWLPVTPRHAWEVSALPLHHRDPFDRLLVAQARVEGIPIVTGDPRFAAYGVDVRW